MFVSLAPRDAEDGTGMVIELASLTHLHDMLGTQNVHERDMYKRTLFHPAHVTTNTATLTALTPDDGKVYTLTLSLIHI